MPPRPYVEYEAINSKVATLTSGTAQSLTDMGFTADELKEARRLQMTTRTNQAYALWDGQTPASATNFGICINQNAFPPLTVEGNKNIKLFKAVGASTGSIVTVVLEREVTRA